MTTVGPTRFLEEPPVTPPAPKAGHNVYNHAGLALLLIASAWAVGRLTGLEQSSNTNYWLGVAGGVLMLLLLLYPLRKRWKPMRNMGKTTKPWFIGHMILGVSGPWIILVHSTFHLGSLNATVALSSMLAVALSGVIGRFLYVKVHLGLDDEREALSKLRAQWEAGHKRWDLMLETVPAVREELHSFESRAITNEPFESALAAWRRLYRLRHEATETILRCRPMLEAALSTLNEPSTPREQRRQLHHWREGLRGHVYQILKVAQFSAWERLFALWHVAHVPFVYVLVICAFAHVFAVHAY